MPRRTHLSVAQKAELRLYYRAHPGLTHEDLIRWAQARFSVLLGRSTVGSILRAPNDTSLNPDAKRNQEGRFPQMEKQLYRFVLQSPDLSQLSDLVLCAKANDLLQGHQSATKSWVFRFKQRHAFSALKKLRKCIDEYEPRDVFNLDETGLFYQMRPRQLQPQLGETKRPKLLTIGLCCNMDSSEKLEPVLIHNEQNGLNDAQIPARIYANDQAWMTEKKFTDWLQAFNSLMEGRRVLLLVDAAPCHGTESNDIELSDVRVIFLPPNTPPYLQPMRAGIIQQFKIHVKILGAQWMLDQRRASNSRVEMKMGLLTAVQHIVQSWQYMTQKTIRNCWAHTGIVSGDMVVALQQYNIPKIPLDISMLDRIILMLELNEPITGLEYINAEENVPEWIPMSEELPPAPRSRRAVHQREDQAELEEKEDDQNQIKPLSHAEALTAALQLSAYAFANRIEVLGLDRLIESARERCHRSSGL